MIEPHGHREVVGRRVAPGAVPRDEFTYSIVDPAPSAKRAGDRRDDARRRTHLRDGMVAERRGRVLTDCLIRDRSRLGARLRLDKDRPLPAVFLLTDAAADTRYWATLVWQTGRDAGVRLRPVEQR